MLTGRVLLLNFSYEPLGTVGVARAVCLWFRGAVFVEENDGDNVLHSPSIIFPRSISRTFAALRSRSSKQP